jgi:hypothetical protein
MSLLEPAFDRASGGHLGLWDALGALWQRSRGLSEARLGMLPRRDRGSHKALGAGINLQMGFASDGSTDFNASVRVVVTPVRVRLGEPTP